MIKKAFKGKDRRKFVRLDYISPLECKICKKQTINKLLEGYTTNISPSGLLCNIKEPVKINDILWLAFDRGALGICENLERRVMIYQSGVIGKVARVEHKKDNTYNVGISFLTREEKNLTNIYPMIHFAGVLEPEVQKEDEEETEEEKLELKEENNEQEQRREDKEAFEVE